MRLSVYDHGTVFDPRPSLRQRDPMATGNALRPVKGVIQGGGLWVTDAFQD